MTIGNSSGKTGMAWLAIALLFAPAVTRARMLKAIPIQSGDFLQDHRRLRTKSRRSAIASKRHATAKRKTRPGTGSSRTAQEKIERLQELYDDGRDDLDEDRYDQAAAKFKQLADMNGRKPTPRFIGRPTRKTDWASGMRRWHHRGREAPIPAKPLVEDAGRWK